MSDTFSVRVNRAFFDSMVTKAVAASILSPCRSKRGVVIWNNGAIISSGFNSPPEPFSCDGSKLCKSTCALTAVHAEQRAIIRCCSRADLRRATLLHVKTVDGLYVPGGPPSCVQCSKLILESGIQDVYLLHDTGWRSYDAVDFHRLSLESAL